ncbi:hypothetical protein BU23DRAFT_334471 [Bimuria novae-zelandiae CBS 107.79]|uniref:Uncharacterized protein n=1 Tax=Bimuria novae-zelandiae CBS 107.79 TaxID=1447943 RepID=A0A6A5UL11_9PLEO|nr:hypothetical protein BU23DRAFT_334471 [Bimuria novae-zelandiae CBS 107.79]
MYITYIIPEYHDLLVLSAIYHTHNPSHYLIHLPLKEPLCQHSHIHVGKPFRGALSLST